MHVSIRDVHLFDDIQINSWRARRTGLTWQLLRIFVVQGYPEITPELLAGLHNTMPMIHEHPASISVAISTIQTLSIIGHAEFVFNFWARQEGRALPPYIGRSIVTWPSIRPWEIDVRWGYDLWTLMVLNEYLVQPRPAGELEFLGTIITVTVQQLRTYGLPN